MCLAKSQGITGSWWVPHGEPLHCSSPAGSHCIPVSCWDWECHVCCTGGHCVPVSCWDWECHCTALGATASQGPAGTGSVMCTALGATASQGPAGSWGVTGRSCSAGSWCITCVLTGHHAPSALPCWGQCLLHIFCWQSHTGSALLGVVVLPVSCWELGCH